MGIVREIFFLNLISVDRSQALRNSPVGSAEYVQSLLKWFLQEYLSVFDTILTSVEFVINWMHAIYLMTERNQDSKWRMSHSSGLQPFLSAAPKITFLVAFIY